MKNIVKSPVCLEALGNIKWWFNRYIYQYWSCTILCKYFTVTFLLLSLHFYSSFLILSWYFPVIFLLLFLYFARTFPELSQFSSSTYQLSLCFLLLSPCFPSTFFLLISTFAQSCIILHLLVYYTLHTFAYLFMMLLTHADFCMLLNTSHTFACSCILLQNLSYSSNPCIPLHFFVSFKIIYNV